MPSRSSPQPKSESASARSPTIRAVRDAELEALQVIERAAGELFRRVGMIAVAEDEPFSVEELEAFRREDQAWVAVTGDDEPIGYVVVEVVDGNAHIEQLSVHPAYSRRGTGRALVEHVASWAARSGLPAVTLTTFAEVPWNEPYYERLGFRTLRGADVTVGLRAKRSVEAARGLDAWPRVCMRRDLPADLRRLGRQP